MQQNIDTRRSAPQPLRAERSNHVRTIAATSTGLLRSSLLSGVTALAVLGIVYMPAEYGVDPTGLGAVLGLAEMGQIKQQLYAEAEADDTDPRFGLMASDPAVMARLDQIEAQLASIRAAIGAPAIAAASTTAAIALSSPAAGLNAQAPASQAPDTSSGTTPIWRDEVSYTLAPGEGIEVKLAMQQGEVARFEWTANGSVVNYDTHGDGNGQKTSYEQGRSTPGQVGELTAAFSGNHGWFWRNRTEAPVVVTLRTAGDYAQLKAP